MIIERLYKYRYLLGSPAINPNPSGAGTTVNGTVTANQGTSPWVANATLQTQADTVMVGGVNIKEINAVTPLMGNGITGTGSLRVTIASDNTAFSVNSTLQTQTDTVMVGGVNIKEINAVTPLMGNGITGTGSLRVTIASDNTAFAVNATLSAETTKVIGTVNQGTSPWVANATLQTQTDTVMVGGVNIKEINAVTPLMGSGIMGTGSLRVTIASDNDALTVKQGTAANLLATVSIASAQTLATVTTVSTVTNLSQIATVVPTFGDVTNAAAIGGGLNVVPVGVYNTTPASITATRYNELQLDLKGNLRMVLEDGANNNRRANVTASNELLVSVNNATLAVTESGTWSVRAQDGAGNALTTNSTTYTAKFGLDANLLGTLGTAFTTAGKVDVKAADGDVFVRQTTATNLKAQVVSGDATGSAVPTNAYYGSGLAKTALPAAGSDGNLTGEMMDKFGRQVFVAGTVRDLKSSQRTTISNSTSETTIVTAGASGIFNDIALIVINNTSASGTRIDFRDATAGTIIFDTWAPANDIRGFSVPGWSIPQTSSANNWTAQCGTAVTDIRITVFFEKNK